MTLKDLSLADLFALHGHPEWVTENQRELKKKKLLKR